VWTSIDPESGIASAVGCDPTTLTAETTGTQLTCTVTNGAGLSSTGSVIVRIDQTPPQASGLSFSRTPLPINTGVTVTGTITDSGSGVASAQYSLDAGETWSAMVGNFGQASVAVSADIPAFTVPGVYNVCVRGTDMAGNTGMGDCALLPVFDPAGSVAAGVGSIDSPSGAYTVQPTLTGTAEFAFVASQKGYAAPAGQAEFRLNAADFKFRSNSYDWLVVSGATAEYKGSGTINGSGDYAFLLTAIDGSKQDGGGMDEFRIKIWDKTTGAVIYDNASSSEPISGGRIRIQSRQEK
jgi:hypothetical protein